MENAQSSPAASSPPKLAERIAALSEIDREISALLLAASSTVTALLPSTTDNPRTSAERREELRASTEEYLRLIGRITRGLRREVVEIETARWRTQEGDDAAIGKGGDKVEKGMEAEVWRAARRWVEELEGEGEGEES